MNRRAILLPTVLLAFTGCATIHIPTAKDEVQAFPPPIENAGYLDLLHTYKLAYKNSTERNSQDIAADFKFSIRKNDGQAGWVAVKPNAFITRIKLTPGAYLMRVDVNSSAYVKDLSVTIEKDRYAMVFYGAEHEFIKNPNSVHEETLQEGAGGGSAVAVLASSIANAINEHKYFIDIQYYPPLSSAEEDLLKSLVNPDWRQRTHVALLLGEHGTAKSLPALVNLQDDVLVHESAQQAIEKLKSSGAQPPRARGIPFHLKPPPNLNLDALFLGQKVTFTVLDDVMSAGKEIAKKGDTVMGEIIFGRPRDIIGFPQLALVQFSYFEKGDVRIPIMKAVEIHGSNRVGWAWGLSLPTLGLSLFTVGGPLETAGDIQVTSMPPVP